MLHAFPEDELRPLSCRPMTRDRENPGHFEINDALGNYSLTLIDSLSTLAVLASSPSNRKRNKPLLLFQDGVQRLVEQYGDGTEGKRGSGLRARGFDLDSKVQVFETAIRGLGGLLSAHLFAVGDLPIRGYEPDIDRVEYARLWQKEGVEKRKGVTWKNGMEYDGQLLRLAHDLGSRLLPAFWTQTGIPYPRVNLRSGIPFYAKSPLNFDPVDGQCEMSQSTKPAEVTETCSAGAGSLVVEFTVLSRLTGDPRFEELAKRAFWAIWNRRSSVGLIGSGIDAETGNWLSPWTGIGAGIDSFFEYAFKSYVLLSRDAHPTYIDVEHLKDPRMLFGPLSAEEDSSTSFYQAWVDAQAAVKRHMYRGTNFQHPHYIQSDLSTGAARGFWIDALSAFYPGVLAQAGHLEEAVETHLLQTALWTRFSALPERWSLITGGIEGGLGWWVGRPEFIESNYHIYRATEDPWYLHVAEMTLRDIKRRCWARCGWTSIQNVLTGAQADRMESFFLGETAKYLFLTFDPDHPLNHLDEPMVFSTEGHPLIIPKYVNGGRNHISTSTHPLSSPGMCPIRPKTLPFSISATAARTDVYHAAALARLHLMPTRDTIESALGEYATDHPSITIADLSSPSNYTYYPWTLPPSLIPHNAMTNLMPTKPTFDISFPALTNQASQPAPPLQRLHDGILINHIGGLKLGMIQDVPSHDEFPIDAYRIQAINNLALGKDEKVYLSRDTDSGVLNPQDPHFTRIRDTVMLDLIIDSPFSTTNTTSTSTSDSPITNPLDFTTLLNPSDDDTTLKSAFAALLAQLSNLLPLQDASTFPIPLPPSSHPSTSSSTNNLAPPRTTVPAITATGIGAAPLPDWPEPPVAVVSQQDPNAPRAPLLWSKIYVPEDAQLCETRLPASVPRSCQVVVLKRGGCSFARKLSNIPTYPPGKEGGLQVVVVVDHDENGQQTVDGNAGGGGLNSGRNGAEGQEGQQGEGAAGVLVRPLLEDRQVSGASGLERREGIPLVMVGGGQGGKMWELLKNARGVGVRRRWEVRCQGVRIDNLVIL